MFQKGNISMKKYLIFIIISCILFLLLAIFLLRQGITDQSNDIFKSVIFIALPIVVIALLVIYVVKAKKEIKNKSNTFPISQSKEEIEISQTMKKMLESIDYANNSMVFDLDPDNIIELKAAKKIIKDIMKSNLNVFDTRDLNDMLLKIENLIGSRE